MKTELKEVAHFYLGCHVQTKIRRETSKGLPMKLLKGKLIEVDLFVIGGVGIHLEDEKHPTDTTTLQISDIKPILRKLSDMTKEDATPIEMIIFQEDGGVRYFNKDTYGIHLCDERCDGFDFTIYYEGCGMDFLCKDNGEYYAYEGAKVTAYLLKQGFDLFNLIESGQAIDATTLK